jgi:hypothetical protein
MKRRLGPILAVVVAMAPAMVVVSCNLDLQPYTDPVDAAVTSSPTSPSTGALPGDPTHPTEAGVRTADAATDGPIEAGAVPTKRVFVSSAIVPGNFNGTLGADSLCNQLADKSLPKGTYLAWVSTRAASASSRFITNAKWQLVDGTVVFPSSAALKTGPTGPIHLDEQGREVSGIGAPATPLVWTGTTAAGEGSVNCIDFTSNVGTGLAGSASDAKKWTENGQSDCASQLHLYCFEQ